MDFLRADSYSIVSHGGLHSQILRSFPTCYLATLPSYPLLVASYYLEIFPGDLRLLQLLS